MKLRGKQLFNFAAVGAVGFCIDAGVVWILIVCFGAGPFYARFVSYMAAATSTWWLNRNFTFYSTAPALGEFARFLLANSLGAAINFAIYSTIVAWKGTDGFIPVAAVAAGVMPAMAANFVVSSTLVFREPQ